MGFFDKESIDELRKNTHTLESTIDYIEDNPGVQLKVAMNAFYFVCVTATLSLFVGLGLGSRAPVDSPANTIGKVTFIFSAALICFSIYIPILLNTSNLASALLVYPGSRAIIGVHDLLHGVKGMLSRGVIREAGAAENTDAHSEQLGERLESEAGQSARNSEQFPSVPLRAGGNSEHTLPGSSLSQNI